MIDEAPPALADDLLEGFEAIGREIGIIPPDAAGHALAVAIKRTRNYIERAALPVWKEPIRGTCALRSELRAYYLARSKATKKPASTGGAGG